MSAEIVVWLNTTGLTSLYIVLEDRNHFVKAADGTLLTATASNFPQGKIAITDTACPGRYVGDMPAGIIAGAYSFNVYQQAGGSAVSTDPRIFEGGAVDWRGTDIATLSEIADAVGATAAGQVAISHNTGGTDNLRYVSSGVGIAAGMVRVYLKSTYDSGIYSELDQTVTNSDGRWYSPLYVSPGATYSVVLSKPGSFQPSKRDVTV